MLTASGHAAASVQVPAIYLPASELNGRQLLGAFWAKYSVELSDNKPENLIRSPLAAYWLVAPSHVYLNEMLDWDAAIEVAPRRPSGTLSVTLEYGGRGTPTAFEDWD
jgi:hypothetical protein